MTEPPSRRLKVCHLITMLEFGGAQQNTLYTSTHLDPRRFEASLVTGPGGVLDDEARRSLPRMIFAASLKRPVRALPDLAALGELWRILRAERPDVVHTHSSKAGILGRLAAFLAGVPVVLHTYHGFGFHDGQPPLLRRAYIAAERVCGALSHALIFVSEANRKTARALGLGDPASHVLIRSGIALSRFPAKVEERGRLKASVGAGMHKPLVLSVGNLKPQKNPEDFVLAARRVLDEHPEARFLFLGDGELRPRVEGLVIREKLHGKVLFPGWRRDTPELMAAADVFVLTSLWEGLPRSLVEAMRTGLPSVCYDTDGVRDLLRDGENGFLAPRGDVGTLARRVSELLSDEPLRRRLGEAAARSVGEEFDIDAMVRRQEDLYLRLARERGLLPA